MGRGETGKREKRKEEKRKLEREERKPACCPQVSERLCPSLHEGYLKAGLAAG